ncbi:glycogen-branching enzyme [Leifsonia xyli subsp. xyli]|uniref:1,4-alpha-glucan branching enzyme GlgB n=2 Tax=Leifsonia xyli subsp. xyli TaxID=59736 RepID=GLGB_LEIXX|nr:1,4-alpha-glucan branching protein GlgB [Leifsonia xyli]Q6AEU4.1 RecName: Full=1,4-alpha-glucan branching enzyme GlgB; AltName: Full=1,4-alpha-D-glucan:1,4-alpha-D-glucan 6-glucosyl-transferase; AltName: Full=Alpha-(1->4)-glucan branching enzyme; AltName: Full=Glycogen branching enzyme; Short=BE [Leifsonia xyli subsp. xyli str. CTCB07]AAT89101.1 1,4-alpha-glucan branching enzyme [Leifsonia xyli subsp. xyli str. CTCB07]ODA89387.1 glycogen-branching enzyme [Leifsonia xyli subsp. xyli]
MTPLPERAAALPGIDDAVLHAVATGSYHDPHSVLGQHQVAAAGIADPVTVIRTLRPLAEAVFAVLPTGAYLELAHLAHGIWQGVDIAGPGAYEIEARYADGSAWSADDPYRFLPTIGELDLHLIREGRHERLWTALGARLRDLGGVTGTAFTVWAPHARAVRVVGDFNGWDGTLHSLRNMGSSGVWELFVPGVGEGAIYKFDLLAQSGDWVRKIDPMAQLAETPPDTASRIAVSRHEWQDGEWMRRRAASDPHTGPMSIYELHFGSWRPDLGYREAADQLIDYLGALGYTHVEFLPLAEHPFGGSWGYQVTGYYAPTSRFGSPDDLKYLIDRLHRAGIGVLLDWVPGHFPKDDWALARFDGQPLYEHADPRRGEHADWGTYVFDYGNSQVRNFLVANALYWLEEFHIDGLRVDAVASMLYLDYSRDADGWEPNIHGGRENLEAIAFLQEVTATAYKRNPGTIVIAEESTSYPGVTAPTSSGGLGFGLKWNMGWMHDSLQYIREDPLYRSWHHSRITFSFVYAWSESFLLPISHDEVVHGKGSLLGKMPGDHWQQLANMRAYLAFMWAHPGKQLLFMGQEFGQPSEWSEERGLDWWILDQPAHRGLWNLVCELNAVYRGAPALWAHDNDPSGFEWLDGSDAAGNVLAFLRKDGRGEPIAVILNFSGAPHTEYRVGLPFAGGWEELLNTDADVFGGSGVGNFGGVTAVEEPWMGSPASAVLTLPPLGALFLKTGR